MKKTTLLLVLAGAGLTVNAQSRFYLNYSGGLGLSNSKRTEFHPSPNYNSLPYKSLPCYNMQFSLGYQVKRWRFEAGVERSSTGLQSKIITGSQFPSTTPNGYIKMKYDHFLAPLKVGYEIPLFSNFSLMPVAMLGMGYNINETFTSKIDGDYKKTTIITGKDFTTDYNRFSLWTGAELRLQYRIDKRFSVFAAPQFQYMLTNFYTSGNGSFQPVMHNYAYSFNLGLKLDLH